MVGVKRPKWFEIPPLSDGRIRRLGIQLQLPLTSCGMADGSLSALVPHLSSWEDELWPAYLMRLFKR